MTEEEQKYIKLVCLDYALLGMASVWDTSGQQVDRLVYSGDTALAEVFPELVKFIPQPEVKVAKMLPVAQKTMVAELVKMGLELPK